MKRTFSKKLLALLLVVVMAVALVPAAAFAEEAEVNVIPVELNPKTLTGSWDTSKLSFNVDWAGVTTYVEAGPDDVIEVTVKNDTNMGHWYRVGRAIVEGNFKEYGPNANVGDQIVVDIPTWAPKATYIKSLETAKFRINVQDVGDACVAVFVDPATDMDGVPDVYGKYAINLKKGSLPIMALLDITVTETYRVAGADRVLTSIAAAQVKKFDVATDWFIDWNSFLPKVDYVKEGRYQNIVVASAKNFPDALSASYLAYVTNSPILLWNGSHEDELMDEIACLGPMVETMGGSSFKLINDYVDAEKPDTDGDDEFLDSASGQVFIVGGEAAVSGSFEKKIDLAVGPENVHRIGGEDRYITNLMTMEAALRFKDAFGKQGVIVDKNGEDVIDVIITTGENYPDALSASALGRPIMLVSGTELTDAQAAFLNKGTDGYTFYAVSGWAGFRGRRGVGAKAIVAPITVGEDKWFDNAYVIGGPSAVGESIFSTLKAAYGTAAVRVAGSDRYATSAAVARKFFNASVIDTLVCATGKAFPDALCAGPVATDLSAPICLVDEGETASIKEFAGNKHRLVIMGGEGALSSEAVADILLAQGTQVAHKATVGQWITLN